MIPVGARFRATSAAKFPGNAVNRSFNAIARGQFLQACPEILVGCADYLIASEVANDSFLLAPPDDLAWDQKLKEADPIWGRSRSSLDSFDLQQHRSGLSGLRHGTYIGMHSQRALTSHSGPWHSCSSRVANVATKVRR
jgi:hypothetical protein